MNKTKQLLYTTLILCTATLASGAVTIVDWGTDANMRRNATSETNSTPTNTSPGIAFQTTGLELGGGSANDSRIGTTFSSNGSYLSGLIDPAGPNLSTRNFLFVSEQIFINGAVATGNRRVGSTTSYSTSDDWRGSGAEQYQLYAWEKSNFLTGGTISFDATSSLSVHLRTFNNNATGSGLRFVVKNGGTWYYSQANHTTANNNATGIFTLNDPATAQWAVFNPEALSSDAATARSLAMPSSAIFSTVVFDNIQYVGFATENIKTANGESRLGVDNFKVTAIPEPSTYALLAGLLTLGVAALRRRKNS
jgi:hypothetical protein